MDWRYYIAMSCVYQNSHVQITLDFKILGALSIRGGERQRAPALKERNWCMLAGSGEVPTTNREEEPITSACQTTQTTPPTHLEFRVQALFTGLSMRPISVTQVSKVLFHPSMTKTSLVPCVPLLSGHKC